MSAAIKNIKYETMTTAEQWSLLMDGGMSEAELDDLLTRYAQDPQIGQEWQTYHVIGDVLRSADFAHAHVSLSSDSFMQGFRDRLSKEPVVVAPASLPRALATKKGNSILQWTGWLAASGFVVMAVIAIVHTGQDEVLPSGVVNSPMVVAQAPVASPPVAAVSATGAVQQPLAQRPAAPTMTADLRSPLSNGSSASLAGDNLSIRTVSTDVASSSVASAMFDVPDTSRQQMVSQALQEMQGVSEPNIRLVDTPHGRVWRDQRLDPYIFAHQQFRNGLALDKPSDGYMLDSFASNVAVAP